MNILENLMEMKVKQALRNTKDTEEIISILKKLNEYKWCLFNLKYRRLYKSVEDVLYYYERLVTLREELLSL